MAAFAFHKVPDVVKTDLVRVIVLCFKISLDIAGGIRHRFGMTVSKTAVVVFAMIAAYRTAGNFAVKNVADYRHGGRSAGGFAGITGEFGERSA